MPQSDVQTLVALEETDAPLVIGPAIRTDIGLLHYATAISKGPRNRHGNRVRAVRDRVGDLVPVPLNRITICTVAEGESLVRLKDKRLGGPRQSASHGAGFV